MARSLRQVGITGYLQVWIGDALRLEFEGGSWMAVGELKLRGLKICGVLCGGS